MSTAVVCLDFGLIMLNTLAGGVMDGKYVLVTELLLTSNAADWLIMGRDLLSAGEQFAAQGAPRTDSVRGLALGEHLQRPVNAETGT